MAKDLGFHLPANTCMNEKTRFRRRTFWKALVLSSKLKRREIVAAPKLRLPLSLIVPKCSTCFMILL